MNKEEVFEKALLEYKELENFILNYKGNFNNLCEILGGFNITKEYFDINYKNITTTIFNEENKIIISDYIDIWNDKNAEPIESGFNIRRYKGGF